MVPSATLFSCFVMLAAASAQASSLETGQEPTLLRPPELPLRIRRGTPAPCARTTKSACGRTLARQANKRQDNLMSHIFPDEICIQGEQAG
ncbi:hypothetical protein VCV18_007593 [Metarhizium anisopliae]